MNKSFYRLIILLLSTMVVTMFIGCQGETAKSVAVQKEIMVFAGAASKPPLDEASQSFEKQTGIKVYTNYGGSGTILSQMKLAKRGDLYIPGSPDYMVKAEREGVVEPKSVKIVSYLIPVIAVQSGNPKNVNALSDLARPGLKIGIAAPESVCVGLYAVEILEHNKLLSEVAKNIVTSAESCEKTATIVSLKAVDAVIGWHVFHDWDPDKIDVVYLQPQQLPSIAYIPAAVSTYAKDKESAQKFVDFLISPTAQDIFRKWGYIATETEARKYAPDARIGGEYKLPEVYQQMIK